MSAANPEAKDSPDQGLLPGDVAQAEG
jgi:hypothetical protein